MRNALIEFIRTEGLSPFKNERRSVRRTMNFLFKTNDARAVHARVLQKLSENFQESAYRHECEFVSAVKNQQTSRILRILECTQKLKVSDVLDVSKSAFDGVGFGRGARVIRNLWFLTAVENNNSRGLDAGNSLRFWNFLTRDLKDLLIFDGSQESSIPDDCASYAILCARGATQA